MNRSCPLDLEERLPGVAIISYQTEYTANNDEIFEASDF